MFPKIKVEFVRTEPFSVKLTSRSGHETDLTKGTVVIGLLLLSGVLVTIALTR